MVERKPIKDRRIPSWLAALIAAERIHLTEAHTLLVCLHQVLLYANGEATIYADVAKVAARILDASIDRFDTANLARSRVGVARIGTR
jgi:hypothetical protein